MTSTAYIIIKGWGEYSDRGTKPVRVYLDKQRAQETMVALETIYKISNVERRDMTFDAWWKLKKEREPEIKAAYAALGFEADIHDDWELEEAPLHE